MLEKVLKPQYQRDQNNIGQGVKKESRKHFAVLEHKTEASLLCFFLVASVSFPHLQFNAYNAHKISIEFPLSLLFINVNIFFLFCPNV